MSLGASPIRRWDEPTSSEIGRTPEEFLERLGGPTLLCFRGEDETRTRAMTTLLHGNEPSGVRALFQWIQSNKRPAVNLVCFVGAVGAALTPPGFAHRFLSGHQDLNRCFLPSVDGEEGRIAGELLRLLGEIKPDSLIDVHNTSGTSPCYGVSTRQDRERQALTLLFSKNLIVTDLRLGTLMEATEEWFPTVTIECGGAQDPQSTSIALTGLQRYATAGRLDGSIGGSSSVEIFQHPIRVELEAGASLSYSDRTESGVDIIFRKDVDRYNFGVLQPGETLGWLGPQGIKVLRVKSADGLHCVEDVFVEKNGTLEVRRRTRFFMITTNPNIARQDCLFYIIPLA